jgi:hypothetical protein
MGSVFLAVTGAETLYADMGHFGRKAIGVSWLTLVYPCLMLNYMGQGALLLEHAGGGGEPVLPDGARMGAAAAGADRHRGDDHRQPGGHLGRVLGHPPGDPARLPAAAAHAAHEREGRRADLHPGDQLGPAGDGAGAGARLRRIDAAGLGLRHLGGRHDADHHGDARLPGVPGVALEPVAGEPARSACSCWSTAPTFASNATKIPDGGWFPLLVAGVLFTS